MRREAPLPFRLALRGALLTATWCAPLLIRRPPPLWLLPPPTRERALAAMARSRVPALRQLVGVLKFTAALSYGADPRVRAAIGYRTRADEVRR